MKIDILTMHPELCKSPLEHSIISRARAQGIVDINVHNLHDFGLGRYQQVDDTPYGGGPGMVLRLDVVSAALEKLVGENTTVILLEPAGIPFKQPDAHRFSTHKHLLFICGHYEGLDARIRTHLVDYTFSIGDYVLTGGELPALVMIDAIVRLMDGVLGNAASIVDESFQDGLLEAPVYTKPRSYNGWDVPPVLVSGHHAKISEWRQQHAQLRTKELRPDLWSKWLEKNGDSDG
ncbi:MAG: tRNA (guanosine(37)-N1)-methyltransferase TrmD [Myxococcota bacterium]|nr:tRNA (guanosine(37)-N1)-methyltransferase TrmD [Myxococcota bacterium]